MLNDEFGSVPSRLFPGRLAAIGIKVLGRDLPHPSS
jgi:hypothetical protein